MTDEERAALNARIQEAKRQCMDALRPYHNKLRSMIINAALNDLDIEIPTKGSRSWFES